MSQDKPKPSQVQINIKADDATQAGQYSNMARISHTPEEFTLDFLLIHRSPPFGKLQSRILLTPQHAKRLLGAMQENIRKFEEAFGEIQQVGKVPDDVGFVN